MQLTYRGNQYKLSTSAIETVPGNVIGKYRGATLRTRCYLITSSTQSLNLFYRGAHYRAVTNDIVPSGLSSAI